MNRYSSVLPSRSDACTIYDLSEKDRQAVELQMLPGDVSGVGFIGINESLSTVVEKDLETLLRLKVSCDNIGDALEFLVRKAKEATGESLSDVARIGKFLVIGVNFKKAGTHICPFTTSNKPCHTNDIPNYSDEPMITVKNLESRKEFSFNPILIPMIRYHACFAGTVPNRLDPETVCETLGLWPDADAVKTRVEEKGWKLVDYYKVEAGNKNCAIKRSHVTLVVDDLATAYLGITHLNLSDFEWETGSGGSTAKRESPIPEMDDINFCPEDEAPPKALIKRCESERLYCHIFNSAGRSRELYPEVVGFGIDQAIIDKGVYVFELHKYTRLQMSSQ